MSSDSLFPSERRIGVLALPGIQALEVAGPYDVFRRAAYFTAGQGKAPAYRITVMGRKRGPIGSANCLQLIADAGMKEVCVLDTLLVVGGFETPFLPLDPPMVKWLRRMAANTRRVCGVCAGAFALAEAGLLDNRKAVCHWGHAGLFRERYPRVLLDPDPIFVRDGHIYTSAGVTAGMDLALALVEEDLGRELALTVARSMVLFLRRPGTQRQFSLQLSLQSADRKPLQELQAWMQDNLNDDLSVAALAARVGMSARNFARVFTQEVGLTPLRYVEQIRVDAARRRLEESSLPVKIIASETGLGSVETMRRLFAKTLRTSPGAYRDRFRTSWVQ